jgi:hypothetical protein
MRLAPGSTGYLAAAGIDASEGVAMLWLIVVFLVLWAVLSVVGFVVKGLVWLAIIGLVLFVGTAVIGFVRRKSVGR